MACVVRGNPPASLNQDLQDALELMVVNSAEDLENFAGDPAPFKKNRHFFQPFLEARYEEKPRKLPFLIRVIPATILLVIGALIFLHFFGEKRELKYAAYESHREELRLEAKAASRAAFASKVERAVEKLNNEPGLAPARVAKIADGKFEVVCLKDELARDPMTLLVSEETGLSPEALSLVIKPYVSMDREIVELRIAESLRAPDGVKVEFNMDTGVLALKGTASLGWILQALNRAAAMTGVREIDTKEFVNEDIVKMKGLIDDVNKVVIHFPLGKSQPVPEDAPLLEEAMDKLRELELLAPALQVTISLAIYGHADSTGQALRNYELSQERTKTVAALLYSRQSFMTIRNFGMGSEFSGGKTEEGPPKEDPESRKIELRVFVEGAGAEAASILGLDIGQKPELLVESFVEIGSAEDFEEGAPEGGPQIGGGGES
jgi:outer membrane protein OmpA-like peptidoglycan-associated protein